MSGYSVANLIFSIFNIVLILAIAFIAIYGFVLFVKLAKRGIKALDLYLNEKNSTNYAVLPKQTQIAAPVYETAAQNRAELSAVIAASIATVMGTDVEGIRIVSCKKIG